MNPEQQRIAIAEACGWVERIYGSWGEPNNPPDRFGVKHKVWDDEDDLPDYLNDLNAMHAAEEVLNPPPPDREQDRSKDSPEWIEYERQLALACPMGTWIRATAAQRAEAFLRTIGKWKEEA